ncbi:P-loop containing nucleoside triphosphate hydrolase protein [Ascobolus immersus RN42]|uniref:P-loop containing nucleoside triphosphate hydrolase protein n=1 Tax=Ascobolus immersus RN42 TaxID=1160509 RepID=A0A3N4IJX7_ASCIM|nr:P-loop containing nucleoside triphosphate hydrolase protein [Ascobolus immersus RN42]
MAPVRTFRFKMLLLGDLGVGKSTFIKRFANGKKDQIGPLGVEIYPLEFKTTSGNICFEVWDTAGQEQSGTSALKDEYYLHADCAIIMFDHTSRLSFKRVSSWHKALIKHNPDIPIVICSNKADVRETSVTPNAIGHCLARFINKYDPNATFLEISAKANYKVQLPFLWLARECVGNPDLEFEEMHELVEPERKVQEVVTKDREKRFMEQFVSKIQELSDDEAL